MRSVPVDMRLLFIAFAPLDNSSGHLARFRKVLPDLSHNATVWFHSLSGKAAEPKTIAAHPLVRFSHFAASIQEWKVTNVVETLESIDTIVKDFDPDAIVLLMEVWDLMRYISVRYPGKRTCVVLHAMPFLTSPTDPTGDFEADVIEYCASDIEPYQRRYNADHYGEATAVLSSVTLLAASPTVAYYVRTYFPGLPIHTLEQISLSDLERPATMVDAYRYDLAYIARMESGKGIECLAEILDLVSAVTERPVSAAIAGRCDDSLSRDALEKLISPERNSRVSATYVGWVDNARKREILAASRAFLYPSYRDNLAVVIHEALSQGRACVTWDLPFTRLNYADTHAVRRVSFGSMAEIARATAEAIAVPSYYADEAMSFLDSFATPHQAASADAELFRHLIATCP